MKRTEWLVFFVVLTSLGAGAGCYYPPENPAEFYSRTPDQDREEVVWAEEVRTGEGRVVGYLEKVRFHPRGYPNPTTIYYVYGSTFGKVPEGSITGSGRAMRFLPNGKKITLSEEGVREGTQAILEVSEQIYFYRNGERQIHD